MICCYLCLEWLKALKGRASHTVIVAGEDTVSAVFASKHRYASHHMQVVVP